MAEWLVEEGIGEHRAVLPGGDDILASRLHWPGRLTAGQVEDALLVARASGSTRGTARFASGEEALVERLPPVASEGAPLRLLVTRAAIAERGRMKRAQARPTALLPRPAPALSDQLRDAGETVRVVYRLPCAGWDELIADAFHREITFAGGGLLLSVTPAMTLIDVDGAIAPKALALAAVPAIAAAIRRLDLAGSIGIDFPTLGDKADRRAVDDVLGAALAGWPHERTAMNGFGFVQLVARLERPSILARVARDPAGAAARLLLRRAEQVPDPGLLLLTAPPPVRAAIRAEWEAELARRTGRAIRWAEDSALAPEASFAQAVPA